MKSSLVADTGSFKEPAGRVYRIGRTAGGHRILRGLNQTAATVMAKLLAMPFFKEIRQRFLVRDRLKLKGGLRELFLLEPTS